MFFSAAFKAKARDALRQHWQTALLIALIVNLPSLLVQGIAAFTNNDPLTRVQDLMIRAYSSQTAMNTLQDSILKLFSETGILVMTGLSVLVWLITPALSMGMNHCGSCPKASDCACCSSGKSSCGRCPDWRFPCCR